MHQRKVREWKGDIATHKLAGEMFSTDEVIEMVSQYSQEEPLKMFE